MCAISSFFAKLRSFVADFEEDQFLPQAKWLRDMLSGALMAHSLTLAEIGLKLDDRDGREDKNPIHTIKRLSGNLNSDRFDDDALEAVWWEKVEPHLNANNGEGVVIGVDYSDLKKPWARPDKAGGMEMACLCRDGSTGTTNVMGYPVFVAEASLPNGATCPVMFRPYSYLEPEHTRGGEPKTHLAYMAEVAPHVGSRAWWTMDRGYDNKRFFDGCDEIGIRWIIRMKVALTKPKKGEPKDKTRVVFLADGSRSTARKASYESLERYTDISRKNSKGQAKKLIIGARKIRLSNQKNPPSATGPARTLVTVWGFGKDPMVLLAGEYVSGKVAVLQVLDAYLKRWKAEEVTRQMKHRRRWGLDMEVGLRALKFRGIKRLVFLACILRLFFLELRLAGGDLFDRVVDAARSTGGLPKADYTYRLMAGAGRTLARMASWMVRRWARGGDG